MRFLRFWLIRAHWSVLLYILCLLAIELCYWIDLAYYTHRPVNEFGRLRDLLLGAGAVGYGVWRILGWHPVFREDYREWLLTTPWNGREPLPLGPVELAWKDLVVVGALFAWANVHPIFPPHWLPLYALMAYLILLIVSFQRTRLWGYFYGLTFGMGVVLWFFPQPLVATCLALALYGFALFGIRKTLLLLPRHEGHFDSKSWHGFGQAPPSDTIERWIGWPHDSLEPACEGLNVTWGHGLMLSLASGWLFYAALSLCVIVVMNESRQKATMLYNDLQQDAQLGVIDAAQLQKSAERHERMRANEEIHAGAWGIVSFAAIIFAQIRLFVFRLGYRPPISLWGRLLTGRWIIRGYDRMFVAPLCAVLLVPCSWTFFHWIGAPTVIGAPLALTAILLTLLNMGPTLLAFRCASPARLVPHSNSRDSRRFVQI